MLRVKEFQPKIELEGMKWRISRKRPQKNKALKLREWFSTFTWFTEDQDLAPEQWVPGKNLSPSSSQ